MPCVHTKSCSSVRVGGVGGGVVSTRTRLMSSLQRRGGFSGWTVCQTCPWFPCRPHISATFSLQAAALKQAKAIFLSEVSARVLQCHLTYRARARIQPPGTRPGLTSLWRQVRSTRDKSQKAANRQRRGGESVETLGAKELCLGVGEVNHIQSPDQEI